MSATEARRQDPAEPPPGTLVPAGRLGDAYGRRRLFRGAERARAFGFFGATVGVSTAAGPVLGGLIIALYFQTGLGFTPLERASRWPPSRGSVA